MSEDRLPLRMGEHPPGNLAALTRHLEKHVGPIHIVFHEIVSDDLHIDVLHVKSTLFRRYEVLVTSGMSEVAMAVPEDAQQPRFAEVMVVLPKGWPLTKSEFADERAYWPVRLIKDLARFPYYGKTWLGYGHSVANGAEEEQRALAYCDGTELCASIVVPSMTLGRKAWTFRSDRGDEVALWCAVPIHADELAFKREHGVDALLDLFDQHGVTDRIDPQRKSVIGSRAT